VRRHVEQLAGETAAIVTLGPTAVTIDACGSILALRRGCCEAVGVSRIFLSHSSSNNAEAVALRDWLADNGWKDEIFIDLDPQRGIAAGERWECALNEAANRCEAVLFLVSNAWLGSGWCLKEFNLAHKLNKRLFGVLIEDLPVNELPVNLTSAWQIVWLATGRDHVMLRALLPIRHEEAHVTFSAEGLARLKHGLEEAGLDPKYFAWPPQNDPNRPPYRGLRPLEAEDAGIFFGRDGAVVEALDALRGLRGSTPPRLLVILGASGAGKSSFLRAGLIPRLARDDRNFLPLPVIRPGQAAISGETGLLAGLEGAFAAAMIPIARADLRVIIHAGTIKLKPLLQALADRATPMACEPGAKSKPPTLILSIDQAEELFRAEAQNEAQAFLALLRDLLKDDAPATVAVFTIRSDNYERLQLAPELEGLRQDMLSLPPMPKGSYGDVVKGPPRRMQETARALEIDDGLVDALLADIEAGGTKDALPLLAFTLERLYAEFHAGGYLKLSHYNDLGRLKGSIEAAVERALNAANQEPAIPKDRSARLAVLRHGLIPWLAGIDPDTGAPRRRVARLSEIPAEARPLIQLLVEQRLLATDVATETGEPTIEPAHEALLRQWGLLGGWLAEDAGLLAVLEGIKRASRDWAANNRDRTWLTHAGDRLAAAERLAARPDLVAHLESSDRGYIDACQKAETDLKRGKRLTQTAIYVLLAGIILGLVGWINQDYIKEEVSWWTTARPYAKANIWPYVLSAKAERALNPMQTFRECAKDCPEMVVVPAGTFVMGSPESEKNRLTNEGPPHKVSFAKLFAVSKFNVTFADWDACTSMGGCPQIGDSGFGRGTEPVFNVNWNDARGYVAWLSRMTGQSYRLLTEAEWEYAARAGTTTAYYWGDAIGNGNASCNGCGSQWDNQQAPPVGSFNPNAFGLYDMAGNLWQWVEDCYHDSYDGAPADGSVWTVDDCKYVVARGGSWDLTPGQLRSASRGRDSAINRTTFVGFRVARTLIAP
jgi:formylglycine-generating enzyme required for sulfatase activity